MEQVFVLVLTAFLFLTVRFALKLRSEYRNGVSIVQIPGPPSHSYMLGHMAEWLQGEAGEADFRWQREYGHVLRLKGILNEDRLLISDPKALHYIYHTAHDNFVKARDRREGIKFIMGPSVLAALGADHKRYRRVLAPALATPESRALMPVFRQHAQKLCDIWRGMIIESNQGQATINVVMWLSRATLDALGHAAFDYHFGALENTENKLSKAYHDILVDAYVVTSPRKLFVQQLLGRLPPSTFRLLAHLPSKAINHMRNLAETGTAVAHDIVAQKTASLLKGHEAGKDVMSLLVKANLSQNKSTKLSDEELYAQMKTLMLAGHETTSNSLTWALWELAKNPTIQAKLRAEIRVTGAGVGSKISLADMDAMPYCLAVIKETFRYHPPLYTGFKQALKDDKIPITQTLLTANGKAVNEIPVSAGTNVLISICGYNRSKDVWGNDAHVFRPERWLENDGSLDKIATPFGAYANLASFAHGPASCMGVRFAITEFQTFLVEIIDTFTFSVCEGKKIRRAASGVMAPMVEGELEKGAQLPLVVAFAD